jgi:transcriptional regulator with XRE-family HTH domain
MINVLTPLEQRFYEIVGERVRRLRSDRLTQEGLASRVGLKRTSITNLERGNQKVPLHVLLRLSRALSCELAALLPTTAELDSSDHDRLTVASSPFKRMPEKTSAVIRQYTVASREDSE